MQLSELLILLVMAAAAAVVDDQPYCAVRYRRLCQGKGRHVACQYPTSGPGYSCTNYTQIKFTSDLKHFIAHYINRRRQRIAAGHERVRGGVHLPRPELMMFVEWDRELASLAQRLADQCNFVHDDCRATVRYPYAGQTVGEVRWRRSSDSDELSAQRAIRRVFDAWWGERRRVEPRQLTAPFRITSKGSVWGHFSQIAVWTLRAVGCGAVRHGIEHPRLLLVCDFSHTNMLGQRTLTPGKTAACPDHTVRRSRSPYPLLCASVKHQIQYEPADSDMTTAENPFEYDDDEDDEVENEDEDKSEATTVCSTGIRPVVIEKWARKRPPKQRYEEASTIQVEATVREEKTKNRYKISPRPTYYEKLSKEEPSQDTRSEVIEENFKLPDRLQYRTRPEPTLENTKHRKVQVHDEDRGRSAESHRKLIEEELRFRMGSTSTKAIQDATDWETRKPYVVRWRENADVMEIRPRERPQIKKFSPIREPEDDSKYHRASPRVQSTTEESRQRLNWKQTRNRPRRPGANALLDLAAGMPTEETPSERSTALSLKMDAEDVDQMFRDTGFNPSWRKKQT